MEFIDSASFLINKEKSVPNILLLKKIYHFNNPTKKIRNKRKNRNVFNINNVYVLNIFLL